MEEEPPQFERRRALGRDEALALAVDAAVLGSRQDSWRDNRFKVKKVRLAIIEALRAHGHPDDEATAIVKLVKDQRGY